MLPMTMQRYSKSILGFVGSCIITNLVLSKVYNKYTRRKTNVQEKKRSILYDGNRECSEVMEDGVYEITRKEIL